MFWLVAVGKRDWFVVVGRVFAISGLWLDRSLAVWTRLGLVVVTLCVSWWIFRVFDYIGRR